MRKHGRPSLIRVEGETAFIFLKEGFEAVIDADDVPLVSSRRWRLLKTKKKHTYACSGQTASGDFTTLHRLLLNPLKKMKVDHEDGDGLNNRRSNIRQATGTQNNANSVASKLNKLGVKGVKINGSVKGFRAVIKTNGKMRHLGYFPTIELASEAYLTAAQAAWGEFAKK